MPVRPGTAADPPWVGKGLPCITPTPGQVHRSFMIPACHQVRLGEKEALDSFLGWLEARQQTLPKLEYYQVGVGA